MVNGNGVDYSKQSDEFLMTSFQEGDEKAYTELYGRYFDKIVGFCFQLKVKNGGWGYIDEDSLKDISQNALLNVYHKKHMYNPEKSKFHNWIFTIARNLLVTEHRKWKAGPTIYSLEKIIYEGKGGSLIISKDSIVGGNLTEELDTLFMQNQINAGLKKLSKENPKQYIPLKLHYVYGFDYVSISKRIGTPLGTVKARVWRGKEILKEIILENSLPKSRKAEKKIKRSTARSVLKKISEKENRMMANRKRLEDERFSKLTLKDILNEETPQIKKEYT